MIKIKTNDLKTMISKSLTCSGPVGQTDIFTKLITLKVVGDILKLITFDGNNYLVIKHQVENTGDDFVCSVDNTKFPKLISKISSDSISISYNSDSSLIEIKGNGKYRIPVEVSSVQSSLGDDAVSIIEITPVDINTYTKKWDCEINPKQVKDAIYTNESVTKNIDGTSQLTPYLRGFYITDNMVVTTNQLVATYNMKGITSHIGSPILASKETLKLLALSSSDTDTLSMYETDIDGWTFNYIYMCNDEIEVYGLLLEDIDKFPYQALLDFNQGDFRQVYTIKRDSLLNALDRLSIFASDDVSDSKNHINFVFSDGKLILSDIKELSVNETVDYNRVGNESGSFSGIFNTLTLISTLKAHSADYVSICHQDNSNMIKIVGNNLNNIVILPFL